MLDGVVLTLEWHTVDHALTYVMLGMRKRGEHVLLFSVGKGDIRLLAEADVDAYQMLHDRCRDAGVHLSDWLVAGGGWYRSMQLATMPPEDRDDPASDWQLDAEPDA